MLLSQKLQVYLSRDPCGAKQCLLKRLSHYLPDCQRLLDDIAYYIAIIIYSLYNIDIEDIVNFLRPCRTAPLPVSALGSLASGLGSRQLLRHRSDQLTSYCHQAAIACLRCRERIPSSTCRTARNFCYCWWIRIWWRICRLFRLPLECGSLEWWPVWFHRTALWPRLLHWHQPLCWPTHGHDLRIARSW